MKILRLTASCDNNRYRREMHADPGAAYWCGEPCAYSTWALELFTASAATLQCYLLSFGVR